MEFRGDGLLLRPWRPDDASALVQVYDDPEAALWTPVPAPFDLEEARAYLGRAEKRRADGFVQLAIAPAGGAAVGEVLLMPTELPDTCELGYAVAAARRGRGFATKALRLMLPVAIQAGYSRARLRIAEGNLASEAVATRLHFVRDPCDPVEDTRKGRRVRLAQWSRDLTPPMWMRTRD